MNKFSFLFLLIAFVMIANVLFFVEQADAAIIRLKNGEVFAGEIVSRTSRDITVLFKGVGKMLFRLDEIESIDESKKAESLPKEEQARQDGQESPQETVDAFLQVPRGDTDPQELMEQGFSELFRDAPAKNMLMSFTRSVAMIILIIVLMVGGIGFFVSKALDQEVVHSGLNTGLLRRLSAFIIDLLVGCSVLVFLVLLLGLIIPLDGEQGGVVFLAMFALQIIFFWYFYFGYVALENTYGRYVMKIKVQDIDSEQKPGYGQAFKRALLLGFWPIEIAMMLFTKTRRRMGDRWAGTQVVKTELTSPWFKRALPGLLIVAIVFGSLYKASPVINNRMEISKAAKVYLSRNAAPGEVGVPSRVEIDNNQGFVTFKLKNRCMKVNLVKKGKHWSVRNAVAIPENRLGKGFSIRQGGASIKAF